MSEFWKPENLRFAVLLTAFFYWFGIYFFMLPAYLERRKHPRSTQLPRVGLVRRANLYTLIFIFSPIIFLLVILGALLWGVVSILSIIMLMAMSPFHWLFSHFPSESRFSITRWKRLGGRMFEYSRKLFLLLAGEQPLQEMETLKEQPKKR